MPSPPARSTALPRPRLQPADPHGVGVKGVDATEVGDLAAEDVARQREQEHLAASHLELAALEGERAGCRRRSLPPCRPACAACHGAAVALPLRARCRAWLPCVVVCRGAVGAGGGGGELVRRRQRQAALW